MTTINLLNEARELLKKSSPNKISYFGDKPWYDRPLTKLHVRLAVGVAAGLVVGSSVLNLYDYPTMLSKVVHLETDVEQNPNEKVLAIFKKEYPSINLMDIHNKRDVSRSFIGKNNFIALAAEMEGFRGDLHKDPGTGLNIGFGYNISKRVGASNEEVVADLSSIGMSKWKIDQIIELSKQPQEKLDEEIAKFNKKLNLENNQLITIQQGVALLRLTQNEYRRYAQLSFADSFDKMPKNQQEVLTYVAYKTGFSSLNKYTKAIEAADKIFAENPKPSTKQLKKVAKELVFFYKKDGKNNTLDQRATIIAHTFLTQDYLSVQIGKFDNLKHSLEHLFKNQIEFKGKKFASKDDKVKSNLTKLLDKLRSDPDNRLASNTSMKMR